MLLLSATTKLTPKSFNAIKHGLVTPNFPTEVFQMLGPATCNSELFDDAARTEQSKAYADTITVLQIQS